MLDPIWFLFRAALSFPWAESFSLLWILVWLIFCVLNYMDFDSIPCSFHTTWSVCIWVMLLSEPIWVSLVEVEDLSWTCNRCFPASLKADYIALLSNFFPVLSTNRPTPSAAEQRCFVHDSVIARIEWSRSVLCIVQNYGRTESKFIQAFHRQLPRQSPQQSGNDSKFIYTPSSDVSTHHLPSW